jgi:hypothetical protein
MERACGRRPNNDHLQKTVEGRRISQKSETKCFNRQISDENGKNTNQSFLCVNYGIYQVRKIKINHFAMKTKIKKQPMKTAFNELAILKQNAYAKHALINGFSIKL